MSSLFDRLTSFPNLLLAARKAQRGKRLRPNVSEFAFHLEPELFRLQEELRTQTYRSGDYRTFLIRDKKIRMISAAPYRDRVVHHALCNIIEPIFERGFIDNSFACRKGKGTHAAVNLASAYCRRYRYVLKCDISRYFPSVDHTILYQRLTRRIWDEGVLWLLRVIIDGSNPQPLVHAYFPNDQLFTPLERRRGLPIGNQTSQFFANVYLDGLDHAVLEQMKIPGYIRYVDDLLLFADDKGRLHEAQRAITQYCESLRLQLHPGKCRIFLVARGFPFLGYHLFPTHRRLDSRNVRRFARRLRRYEADVTSGTMKPPEARACVQSWVAHAEHADTRELRRQLFSTIGWVV